MSQEYEFIELTPDVYENIQHEIASTVASNNREIDDCYKAIYVGNKKIQELEDEIDEIEAKVNEYKNKLTGNRRSIKANIAFLNKLNRYVYMAKPAKVDVEKKLVKTLRKAK